MQQAATYGTEHARAANEVGTETRSTDTGSLIKSFSENIENEIQEIQKINTLEGAVKAVNNLTNLANNVAQLVQKAPGAALNDITDKICDGVAKDLLTQVDLLNKRVEKYDKLEQLLDDKNKQNTQDVELTNALKTPFCLAQIASMQILEGKENKSMQAICEKIDKTPSVPLEATEKKELLDLFNKHKNTLQKLDDVIVSSSEEIEKYAQKIAFTQSATFGKAINTRVIETAVNVVTKAVGGAAKFGLSAVGTPIHEAVKFAFAHPTKTLMSIGHDESQDMQYDNKKNLEGKQQYVNAYYGGDVIPDPKKLAAQNMQNNFEKQSTSVSVTQRNQISPSCDQAQNINVQKKNQNEQGR